MRLLRRLPLLVVLVGSFVATGAGCGTTAVKTSQPIAVPTGGAIKVPGSKAVDLDAVSEVGSISCANARSW